MDVCAKAELLLEADINMFGESNLKLLLYLSTFVRQVKRVVLRTS